MDSNSNGDPRWHDMQEVSVTSKEWCATVHFIHTKDDDAERDQGHISLDFHVSVLPLWQIKPRQWETDQVSTSTSQMIKGLQTPQLPLFGTNPRNSHIHDTQTKCIWCVPFLLGHYMLAQCNHNSKQLTAGMLFPVSSLLLAHPSILRHATWANIVLCKVLEPTLISL